MYVLEEVATLTLTSNFFYLVKNAPLILSAKSGRVQEINYTLSYRHIQVYSKMNHMYHQISLFVTKDRSERNPIGSIFFILRVYITHTFYLQIVMFPRQ